MNIIKNILVGIIFLTLLGLASCGNKRPSQKNFKFYLGNSATAINGGAYIALVTNSASDPKIIKLDGDNSAIIPRGTYDLQVITFEGPEANSGEMYCGALLNTTFSTSAETLSVGITQADCTLAMYRKAILILKTGIIPKWDADRFDLSKWGP